MFVFFKVRLPPTKPIIQENVAFKSVKTMYAVYITL